MVTVPDSVSHKGNFIEMGPFLVFVSANNVLSLISVRPRNSENAKKAFYCHTTSNAAYVSYIITRRFLMHTECVMYRFHTVSVNYL